jgi:uncharacterized membrane protein YqgA involved in biofilm formation
VLGPLFNTIAILVGGVLGFTVRDRLTLRQESFLKIGLAVFTVFYGLRLTCLSLAGSAGHVLKLSIITMVALMLGKAVGRLFRLQSFSNRLGKRARDWIQAAVQKKPTGFREAFLTGTILFCTAPLGMVGALADALAPNAYPYPLVIKGIMDGLATMAFVRLLGPGVICSALPVLVLQGTIFLVARTQWEAFLRGHDLLDPILAVTGIMIFCVALIILELKKVPLAEYLPALLLAPATAWLFR